MAFWEEYKSGFRMAYDAFAEVFSGMIRDYRFLGFVSFILLACVLLIVLIMGLKAVL